MCGAVLTKENNLYAYYEGRSRSRINRICIDGRVTGCGKCVGYCQYSGHPGFLTKALRKQHNCISRNCHHYVSKPLKEKRQVESRTGTYLNKIGCILQPYEGMRVLGVDATNEGLLLRYITITNSYSLGEITEMLEEKLGCSIIWKRLDYSFDVCAKLLLA